MAKMAVARVKLLRNKREVVIKQMRRDIAMFLESGQDSTARIRVEHVIREQNIMAANELIELFCELVVARLSIIAKQRECPADLKEGISSLIFAAPRCSDIPELLSIRDVFHKKYGKDFVSAATDLRPNAGVNRMLIEKLSVKTPSGEIKFKVLKEIAKEYQGGPEKFESAASLPLKPVPKQNPEPINTSHSRGQHNITTFEEVASAAGVAAEKALAAAEAAAVLAAYQGVNDHPISRNSTGNFMPSSLPTSQAEYSTIDDQRRTNGSEHSHHFDGRKMFRRRSCNCQRAHTDIKVDESDSDEEVEMEEPPLSSDMRKINRRHSYNVQLSSDIRYDESDHDDTEEEKDQPTRGTNRPPDRPAPQVPARRVHPKLPDYDALAARFEALKHRNATHTK
ncbi:hypothetical protein DH2020_012810 [Rehmannia glutinosa]|uniref:IST1-like protein n=1 Tax=Rehmannia glutinosa TaxID=99300 RepID=A0ABR0X0U0_REHGL